MAATEYDVIAESATQRDTKPEFNPQTFAVLLRKINAEPTLIEGDWRDLVRNEFQLDAEQEWSLVNVADTRVEEIQSCLMYFAEQIRNGASIDGRIIRLPIEEQTPAAVHGVLLELVPPDPSLLTIFNPRMLRIAHCDAHCRNWQWNSF
jgi:hypothetical protein